jgi:RHS repeat-associated protein
LVNSSWTLSFYGYDGSGSVRQLTDASGVVTDTYDYDAFGNKIGSTGMTPNNYLYRGEQYDPDLDLYYLRARYYNPSTGRFMSRDPDAGNQFNPKSLHKYLYANGDSINRMDATGRAAILETGSIDLTIDEPSLPALREFGRTLVRILCDGIETVAKYIPTVSGPYMNQLSLIRLFANLCAGFGFQ